MEIKKLEIGRIVALIPARSGSKGLPDKNLLEINGKSLIQRAIESSQNDIFDIDVYVSSDDQKILKLAIDLGSLPHERDKTAAEDESTARDVVADFLTSKNGISLSDDSIIIYLQPTSPFRNSQHVVSALNISINNNLTSCVSVRRAKDFPEKMTLIDKNGFLTSYIQSRDQTTNRQDLGKTFYPNGAIYIFKVGIFKKLNDIPVLGSMAYEMDFLSSVDIDDYADLVIARGISENEPF